jgi:hypothetical protein
MHLPTTKSPWFFDRRNSPLTPDDSTSWTDGISDPPPWTSGYSIHPPGHQTLPHEVQRQRRQFLRLVEKTPLQAQPLFSTANNRVNPSILHTKHLPTLDVFLDQALTRSATKVSAWQKPNAWTRAESRYINSIIQDLVLLTGNGEMKQAIITNRLIVYPVSCYI